MVKVEVKYIDGEIESYSTTVEAAAGLAGSHMHNPDVVSLTLTRE